MNRPQHYVRRHTGTGALPVGALVGTLVVLMSCNSGDPDDAPAISVATPVASTASVATDPASASSTPTAPPPTTSQPAAAPTISSRPPTTPVPEELPSLPLPGFAFEVDSEFQVVRDLRGLTYADGLLFAFTPPETMLRIDPAGETTESMDLGIGPSVDGAPSWAVVDDTMWLIGGAFRNQLIEIDATTMTEVRRIDLEDDHRVGAATAADVWLHTAQAVRRFDVVSGTLAPPIELDVDPGATAVAEDGTVWVSLPVAGQVARIEPATGRVDNFDVAPGPASIAADRTAVWVSHPSVASVSRLDPLTGETIQLIDLDLSGGEVASAQTGALQAVEDGIWVTVSFPGSKFRSALALIGRNGRVLGARSVQFDSHTWEAVDGAIWIHRLGAGSIIRSAVDDLGGAPPTDEQTLLPAVSTTSTTTPMPTGTSQDERSLLAALDMVLDGSVLAADLGLESQTGARRDLIELAAAQAELRVEPTSLTIEGDTARTVFDVIVEGDTVVLPAVELEWRRTDGTWHLDPASFCLLADGVGITGCRP